MSERSSKPNTDRKPSKPLRDARSNAERHSPRTRDAALRRLRSANRWLIAACTGLTGLFTALAATAFSGRTIKVRDVSKTTSPAPTKTVKSSHRTGSLKASSAPQDVETEGAERIEEEEGGEVLESGPEDEVEASSTPEVLTETEPETTTTTTPQVVEEPVVSGGS